MIIRSVGIDFGTSSVKIAVSHSSFINNEINEVAPAQYVRFDNGSYKTPALIRKTGGKYLYGMEAESTFSEGTLLFSNLKECLHDKNASSRCESLCMIKMYFLYLYMKYKEQFGEIKCDKTNTYLSIPADFDAEAISLIKEAASAAGFANVEVTLEPLAVVGQILQEKSELLSCNYYISEKRPAFILVLDLGAGSSKASVCRYDYMKNEIKLLSSRSEKAAGGSEFDSLLCSFLQDYLKQNGADSGFLTEFKDNYLAECRRFKENILMKNLNKNMATDSCSFISGILSYLESADRPFPAIDRNSFEKIFHDYIYEFYKLIGTVLKDAQKKHSEFTGSSMIDLAVITGGSSSWYFIKDLLLELPMIKSDPERILIPENPELAISAGLVCKELKPDIKTEEKKVPKTPLELQIKFKAEEDYTPQEKKELLTYITGLDLNKEEYKIIFELYDSKKYELCYFILKTTNYKYCCAEHPIYYLDRLMEESGFAPTECMAAIKYFNGNIPAAMKNFYAVSFIEDEKEFQKEAYKMCLSKHHRDGVFPKFLISPKEFDNIKGYYMHKVNGLSKGEGVYGTNAYFIFPEFLFEHEKFYKTNGMTSSILLCDDKIIKLYSFFFSGNISELPFKYINYMRYIQNQSHRPDYAEICVSEILKDMSYDFMDFREFHSKDYLEIGREIFKLMKALYIRSGIKRAANLPDISEEAMDKLSGIEGINLRVHVQCENIPEIVKEMLAAD